VSAVASIFTLVVLVAFFGLLIADRFFFKQLRKNDPVYSCDLFKKEGCAHVDGYLCDFPTCSMLKDWKLERELEKITCPVCGYWCLGKGGTGCIDKPSLVFGEEKNDK
jgi:hypothetical protein